MKPSLRFLIARAVAAAAILTPLAASAGTITMSATYFTIAENDQDMNRQASGVFSNEVENTLGPDGLPILNTTTYGCISNCFTEAPLPADLSSTGEITWWSPSLNDGGTGAVSDVTETGNGTISLPYNNSGFFPPNGTGMNDDNGFQAAIFSSILDVPSAETISFNVGADDVVFVYLDGNIVCDLGGAHVDSPGTCTSNMLAAGNHTLTLFYADIENSGADLTFSVTTSNVTGSAAPEPGSLSLFGMACTGCLAVLRRKSR